MARGRKRLIAGWGLVGAGVLLVLTIIASGTFNFEIQCGDYSLGFWMGWMKIGRFDGDLLDWPRAFCYPSLREFFLGGTPSFHLHWWYEVPNPSFHATSAGLVAYQWQQPHGINGVFHDLVIVMWPLVLILLASGVPMIRSARRLRQRARDGMCLSCGYDVRALTPIAVCPECGTAAARR